MNIIQITCFIQPSENIGGENKFASNLHLSSQNQLMFEFLLKEITFF